MIVVAKHQMCGYLLRTRFLTEASPASLALGAATTAKCAVGGHTQCAAGSRSPSGERGEEGFVMQGGCTQGVAGTALGLRKGPESSPSRNRARPSASKQQRLQHSRPQSGLQSGR